jgi:hypothetical protein
VQIFDIFEQVFGGRSRLVRVVGTQSANAGVTKYILQAVPAGKADALAIAPYFGGSLGNSKNWEATKALSVAEILRKCAEDVANQRNHMKSNRDQATAAGLKVVGYEGGQHLAGVGVAAEDSTLVNKFIEANRHADIEAIYRDYLAAWKAEGLGVFVHFTDVYSPGKWGSWGALERQDQPLTAAHKYRALLDVSRQWTNNP